MKRSKTRLALPVHVNTNVCDGCGKCVEVCPKNVFEQKTLSLEQISKLSFFGRLKVRVKGNSKSFVVKPNDCITCGKCIENCHEHAISVRHLNKRA